MSDEFHTAFKDMLVVAGRLGESVQEYRALLIELDELRAGCSPDELGAICGKRVADFVRRYQAALAKARGEA